MVDKADQKVTKERNDDCKVGGILSKAVLEKLAGGIAAGQVQSADVEFADE